MAAARDVHSAEKKKLAASCPAAIDGTPVSAYAQSYDGSVEYLGNVRSTVQYLGFLAKGQEPRFSPSTHATAGDDNCRWFLPSLVPFMH